MSKIRYIKAKMIGFIGKRPLASFYVSLALLLGVIALVSYLGRPEETAIEAEAPAKAVTPYSIGSTSSIMIEGKVEKGGLLTLVAQTSGIVTKVPGEGVAIKPGQTLLTIATTYSGASIADTQAALAKTQYNFQKQTQDLQQELIEKQRESARLSQENTEALREIQAESVSRTRDQLNQAQSILNILNDNLATLESATQSAQNQALILSTKQLQSQFISANNQLESLLDQTEYQVNADNPPQQLSKTATDITLTQLELQAKSLDLNLEVARLNYRLASINASLNYPSAPFAGKIERVHVRYGQAVNPGTPLLTLSGGPQTSQIVVTIPRDISITMSKTEPAKVVDYPLTPLPIIHISETFADQLSRIIISVPEEVQNKFVDQQTVNLLLPIGYAQTLASMPVIPIDAVHQTQEAAYVFVIEASRARTRLVELGAVTGDRVFISSGLKDGDIIIRERNIADGDNITIN
jgi:multidrug efflux pump subunit AcrA (membrane-fusion protein)